MWGTGGGLASAGLVAAEHALNAGQCDLGSEIVDLALQGPEENEQ